jgi:hypothetical protein
MLLRLQPCLDGRTFAEVQESPQLVSKLSQGDE